MDHKKLKSSYKQLQGQLKSNEDAHNAALQTEKTEVSRLQKELEQAQNEKSRMEQLLKQRDEAAAKQKELLDQSEARASSVQQELDALKAKCDRWLATVTRVNHEMESEFPISFFLACFVSADTRNMPT